MFNSTFYAACSFSATAIDWVATTPSRPLAFTKSVYLHWAAFRVLTFPDAAVHDKAGGPEFFSFSERIPLFTHKKAGVDVISLHVESFIRSRFDLLDWVALVILVCLRRKTVAGTMQCLLVFGRSARVMCR